MSFQNITIYSWEGNIKITCFTDLLNPSIRPHWPGASCCLAWTILKLIHVYTFLETQIGPETWCFENEFPFEMALFEVVSGRVHIYK